MGRPRGNRAILSDKLFASIVESWDEQGDPALARFAFHDPGGYCNMVARLMPQKIEHSTPTDGMTDERLSQLLDLAEGMVALRLNGSTTHQLTHENRTIDVTPEEGGGGPSVAVDAAGGGSTSTSRGVFEDDTPQTLNNVNGSEPKPDWAPNSPLSYKAEEIEALAPIRRSVEEQHQSAYDDRTPVTPYSSSHDIPHPVGRPFPKADHDVERQNKSALAETDDIDPESLF